MLEKVFKLQSNNTSLGKEVLAGITTFVTMAYIIFVNPRINKYDIGHCDKGSDTSQNLFA